MSARVYFDKRSGMWVADYTDARGHRHRPKVARTKTLALAVLNRRLDDVAKERAGNKPALAEIPLEILATQFLEWAEAHRKPQSARRYGVSWAVLKPRFGHLLLKEITPRLVERFMTDRLEAGKKNATVNRDLAVLKCMFSKAIVWDFATDNPLRKVRLLDENNARVRYLTDVEREALLAECHGHLLDIVMVALYTGMRLTEILTLKWQDVDLGRRQIAVRVTKNGEIRHVPIPQPLIAQLGGIPRQVGCPHLFPSRDGDPLKRISTAWDAAVARARIEDFRFHDLRHSYASYFVMAGGNLNHLRQILGHKSMAMTLRYAHLSPEHLHAGADEMARKMASGALFPKEFGTPVAQKEAV